MGDGTAHYGTIPLDGECVIIELPEGKGEGKGPKKLKNSSRPRPRRSTPTSRWDCTRVEGVRFFVYEADGVRRRNVLFRGGARLWRDV